MTAIDLRKATAVVKQTYSLAYRSINVYCVLRTLFYVRRMGMENFFFFACYFIYMLAIYDYCSIFWLKHKINKGKEVAQHS